MPTTEEEVSVTIKLPRSVVDQIGASANRDNHSIEDEIRGLIGMALAIDDDPRELAAQAAEEYEAHLKATGQKRPTTEELWAQMRRIRQEVADELYPD